MKLLPTFLAATINADVYLHMPRGSNNRLNEKSTARANNNRLFDSQNNNNGGYNVADAGDKAAEKMSEQHSEMYFQSGKIGKSYMHIEWFNQHGCGKRDSDDSNAIDCHMIIQYKCDDRLRNGIDTDKPSFSRDKDDSASKRKREDMKKNNEKNEERGEHETWENYDLCYTRNRNEGLFLADQNLKGYSSIYTRQNANGDRRGYECPEERDYFPYWHPTEWTDIAVLTSNQDSCNYYQSQSSNSMAKGECIEFDNDGNRDNHASEANNPEDCEEIDNAQWIEFYDYKSIIDGVDSESRCQKASGLNTNDSIVWGYPRQIGSERYSKPEKACLILHPDIDCKEAPWARANHLGNTDNTDDFASYRWELPHFEEEKQCVLRMRYNISSDDYGEKFDSGDITPYFSEQTLENNPTITTKHGVELKLALNTAQIARTFQDRTHTFKLVPRSDYGIGDDETIENLQVRGKRGNIVQTFPAVEYDFSPQRTIMDKNSLLHIQWAGSNSNPRNNAGQGERGTDRSNMVTMEQPNWNIPVNKLEYETIKSEAVEGKIWMVHRSDYRDYNEAKEHCDSLGMELPVPENEEENDLLGTLEGGNFFLGISDEEQEDRFANIYTKKRIEFEKWLRKEPNNYTRRRTIFANGEDYVVFVSEAKKWNDSPPNYNNGARGSVQTVCVKKIDEIDQSIKGVEYLIIEQEDEIEWTVQRSDYRPFNQAKNYCDSIGMHLPVPLTKSQNQAFGKIDGGNFYLGISDELQEDNFVDVYTEQPLKYLAFARGQPDDHTRPNSIFKNGEDFVVMLTDDREWNDAPNDFNSRGYGSVQTVCVKRTDEFFPVKGQLDMFENVEWIWSSLDDDKVRESNENLAVQMASSGYYSSKDQIGDIDELDNELDNAPASFHGNLIRFKETGHHYFMSTRNNNFSNRAQKGDIQLV